MKTPYIFYPVIFLWLFVIMIDLFIAFDGFDRVRVKLSGGRIRTTRTNMRKKD